MTDLTPFVPILTEATKFMFLEVSKWIDYVRQKSGKAAETSRESLDGTELTASHFTDLEANPSKLQAEINIHLAQANAYTVRSLVEQIQTHRKNLLDLEKAEAEYGVLTPTHIRRAIERESIAVVEKTENLKGILEEIYGKRLEI